MPNYVELSLKENANKINVAQLGAMVDILALNVMGYEEYILYEMEYIDDLLINKPVLEALQMLYHDEFNPFDDYFRMDWSGEFISYSSLNAYYEMLMDKKDELLAAIIKESFDDDFVYNEIDNYLDWNGLLVEQSEGDEDNA